MKYRFTDIHHHILYGLDDGASDREKMQQMLRRAAQDNIGRIIATPHVVPGVKRFDREQYERALQEARAYCRENDLPLELYEGCEILYTSQTCGFLMDGRIPTLAGSDFVLVEFSPDVRYDRMYDALDSLLHSGYLPIVAHVERYACLGQHPARAEQLKDELPEVCFQVNCATVTGEGRSHAERRFLEKLLDWDLVDALGSDAHGVSRRCVQMSAAWKKLKKEFGSAYADELTDGHLLFDHPAR